MDSTDQSSSFPKADAAWLDLSNSDYAKVIFSDLFFKFPGSLGCKFQITGSVDENPSDYIGLFRVGYESLDQCVISKLLCDVDRKDDAKFLHCSFRTQDLPELENGFYQFLYITKEKEVCGASLPFEIKMPKPAFDTDDIGIDNVEDDFLVVGSTLAEQNRELLSKIEKMHHAAMIKDEELSISIRNFEAVREKLCYELRAAHVEKERLSFDYKRVLGEKDDIARTNDEKIKSLEEQIKAITLNVENTCVAFKQMEKEKLSLELERDRIIEEKNNIDAALSTVSKQYKIASNNIEKLQKELKSKESMLELSHVSLASQLENAHQMIEALEDSKKLAHDEIAKLTECILKHKSNQEQLKSQNIYLEDKLKDLHARLEMHEKKEAELNIRFKCLESKLKDAREKNEKHEKKEAELNIRFKCLESELKDARENNEKLSKHANVQHLQVQDLETNSRPSGSVNLMKCKVLALELQLTDKKKTIEKLKKRCAELTSACEEITAAAFPSTPGGPQLEQPSCFKVCHEPSDEKKIVYEKKVFAAKAVTDEQKILNTNASFDGSASASCQCDELRKELDQKIAEINKLKEECLRKDAVVEFLTKDKDDLHTNSALIAEALKDAVLRLKEASDIYKKQYLEIEKLKKKLNKAKTGRKSFNSGSSSVNDDLSSSAANAGNSTDRVTSFFNELSKVAQQAPNSDSDTGERVLGQCLESVKHSIAAVNALLVNENFHKSVQTSSSETACKDSQESGNDKFRDMFGQSLDVAYLAVASGCQDPSPLNRESPELQSLVDKNLAEFRSSNSSTEEQYALPCPVCNCDIGISNLSAEDMVEHLEIQHRQQMCPVCAKLFDMNLPPKYFEYHVQDHFLQDK